MTRGAVGENKPRLTGTQAGRRVNRGKGLERCLGDGEQFCGTGGGGKWPLVAREAEYVDGGWILGRAY